MWRNIRIRSMITEKVDKNEEEEINGYKPIIEEGTAVESQKSKSDVFAVYLTF